MNIKNLRLDIDLNEGTAPENAGKIRGYLARYFWDNSYAHQHNSKGKQIYRYPRVQYKIIDGSCRLIGFNEGMDVVERVFGELAMFNIGGREKGIVSKALVVSNLSFGRADAQVCYSFLTPWLALNQKNYEKYQMLGTWLKRKEMLEKILVGNLISMSKSLGYTVPGPIEVRIGRMREVKTSLKGTPMAGFLGDFSVNFEIPDYWGIGKSVSRGFGTVKKVEELTSGGVEELGS
jgi:hypothetical protein